VCHRWSLVIAGESQQWDAYIYEIELWSGDALVSGPGLGTVVYEDCTRHGFEGSAANAFDGDYSTHWRTCYSKIGKKIIYQLNDPNGVTKVKTSQWPGAGNAVPKFDLFCDSSYIWTADLGSGAGTQEADSGFAPPTAEEITAYTFTTTTTTTTLLPPQYYERPRIWLTQNSHSTDLGIAGADAICTAEAGQPSKAFIGSDESRRAYKKPYDDQGFWPPTVGRIDWPLLANMTYYSFDLTHPVISTNCHGLITNSQAPVSTDFCGNFLSGISEDFTVKPELSCSGFTSTQGQATAGWACQGFQSAAAGGLYGQSWAPLGCGSSRFLCVTLLPDANYDDAHCPDFWAEELDYYVGKYTQSLHQWAYHGTRLVILIDDKPTDILALERSWVPDSPEAKTTMKFLITELERLYEAYDDVIGKVPRHFAGGPQVGGKAIIQVASDINAAGRASHGEHWVVIDTGFFRNQLDFALTGSFTLEHVFGYEIMRNYIFDDFSAFHHYIDNNPEEWGWINQGFVNCVGILLADSLGWPTNYYGQSREQFLGNPGISGDIVTYANNPNYTAENTFLVKFAPWEGGASVDAMWSMVLTLLFQQCGERDYLKRFFHFLPELKSRWPSSSGEEWQIAFENYYIASSVGCEGDLLTFFTTILKFPISQTAQAVVAGRGLQSKTITVGTTA